MDDDDLVRRVNVVYHDVEGAAYQNLHPEIFAGEAERWNRLADRYLRLAGESVVVLDIGCGTGFVGMQIGTALQATDRLICADVSAVMLKVAQSNLRPLPCPLEFIQLSDGKLPFTDSSCDVVTMNSTLHHVPNLSEFFHELGRVLRRGGRLIICHEPNKAYYSGGIPRLASKLFAPIFIPRQAVGDTLRRLGVIDLVRRLLRPFSRRDALYNSTLDEVNRILMAEGSIRTPLSQDQLTSLVDIHSPTAGGFHPERGLDLPALAAEHLPGFVLELYETHNHLGDQLSLKNRLTRRLNARLAGKYPMQGATMVAVLRKKD